MWIQKPLTLAPRARGVHLITSDVLRALPEMQEVRVGLLHLFLQHTSASLALNENASPDVRLDLEAHLARLAPDGAAHYIHRDEGADDMAAHIKNVLVGAFLVLPVRDGQPALGTWQGVYLLEHRNHGGVRRLLLTLFGE